MTMTTIPGCGSCGRFDREVHRQCGQRRSQGTSALRALLTIAALLALAARAPAQMVDAKLLAPDGGQGDNLGWAVASSPGWAFCTAPGDDDVLNASGAVYVFKDTGSGWSFAQKLKAAVPALQVQMGDCVAVSGEWLVAGTPLDAPFGGAYSGSAEVFRLEGGTWVHSQKLVPDDHATTYHVAASADVSGDRMVLGAPDDYTAAGSSYVFELSGSTWVEVAKLFAPELEFFSRFGSAVAIDGDTLAVGAPYSDRGTANSYQGVVYVFERIGSTWQFQQKLVASDPHPNDFFGLSLALEGDRLLVGGYHDHALTDDGAMYVFERQGGVWSQTAELLAFDPDGQTRFGSSVDLEGDLAVGSAPNDDDHGLSSGAAYVFRRNAGGAWLQIAKATLPDPATNSQLIADVSLSGKQVVFGALGDDWACPSIPYTCNAGAAYVVSIAPGAVQYGSCPTQGPCGNHDDFGGCVNSAGTGGELSAAGSSSVSADDLHLQARWLPAGKLGLFFMGGSATSMPFGDGHLCVTSGGAGVWRFNPPQSTGASGVLDLGPGVAGLSSSLPPGGQITPGHIWHFQAWFRDPAGPCGQGSNMTNGVRVNFAP